MMQKQNVILFSALLIVAFQVRAAEIIASGSECGGSCSWSLDDEGNFVLSGTGRTTAFTSSWQDYKEDIINIVIEDGITGIGHNNFSGCTNAKSVDIADSVSWFGNYAFSGLISLETLKLPNHDVSTSGVGIFEHAESLKSVIIPDSWTTVPRGFLDYSYPENVVLGKNVSSVQWLGLGRNFDTVVFAPEGKDIVYGNSYGEIISYKKQGDRFVSGEQEYRSLQKMILNQPIKRIYTIEEAAAVAGKRNSFKLIYK